MARLRLAIVHDWLTGTRGGEKCLEPLCRTWPDATLHTLLHVPGKVSPAIEALKPRTSFLQQLPKVERYYRYLLPLMPFAANWRLPKCDVVLSFSHCVAKAARPPAGVPHLCYCFTPMRYAWHMRESYFAASPAWKRLAANALMTPLRWWDRATADRVTHFIAISKTVQTRIRQCYGRDSTIIAPPVDTDFYTPANLSREDYYLCVSAFAPYKRIDLAIDACSRIGRRLVVIGTGQDERRLRSMAGANVTFLGSQPDDVVRDHYRRCKALLFPGEEDFGIVPVEAMACGAPVIALGRGGAAETVGGFGWLFEEQNLDSLCETIQRFENEAAGFDATRARVRSELYRTERYVREMTEMVERWAK